MNECAEVVSGRVVKAISVGIAVVNILCTTHKI